ncbi:MAG: cation ABC transporter permease [Acidocella sp. 20-57-95]|nr:MAG: cation ABC transporter permease [Acidocella sp. 20-57-95]HQT64403.1 metal ABC transporter permease [Acidocella sp.]
MLSLYASSILAASFWTDDAVHTALIVSTGAALVCGIVGVFTIIRGQSFAGHALADMSSAGGAGSFLAGINPLFGFLAIALLSAVTMELADLRQARERDLAAGIILGAGLGVTALLLYFDVTTKSTTGAAVSIMFGSMFEIPASIIPFLLGIGVLALSLLAIFHRPLYFCSVNSELAATQGIPVRRVGFIFLVILSLSVTLSAMAIGAILSTALLIAPAAAAMRLTKRLWFALGLSAFIGISASWAGIWLAYSSYDWTRGHVWPVSFFIVTILFIIYLASGLPQLIAKLHFGTDRYKTTQSFGGS